MRRGAVSRRRRRTVRPRPAPAPALRLRQTPHHQHLPLGNRQPRLKTPRHSRTRRSAFHSRAKQRSRICLLMEQVPQRRSRLQAHRPRRLPQTEQDRDSLRMRTVSMTREAQGVQAPAAVRVRAATMRRRETRLRWEIRPQLRSGAGRSCHRLPGRRRMSARRKTSRLRSSI
jgi:hypothetical protein